MGEGGSEKPKASIISRAWLCLVQRPLLARSAICVRPSVYTDHSSMRWVTPHVCLSSKVFLTILLVSLVSDISFCMYVGGCITHTKRLSSVWLSDSPSYPLKKFSLSESGARLVASNPQQSFHLHHLPSTGGTDRYNNPWLFKWVLGIWTQVFMVAQQTLLFTESSSAQITPV